MLSQRLKKALVVVHDLTVTAVAVTAAFYIRFDGRVLDERMAALPAILPPVLACAAIVYWLFGLYRAKWRFASLPDLNNIFRAASVMALTLLVADYILLSRDIYGEFFFGKKALGLYWILQMALLGGSRLAYRYFKYARSRQSLVKEGAVPALLIGRSVDIEAVLRAVETGTIKKIDPKAILSPREADLNQSIRGVPVVGRIDAIEATISDFAARGTPIKRLLATQSALAPDAQPELMLAAARRHGLPLMRIVAPGEGAGDAELAPVEIEDLILRPTVEIDRERLQRLIRGRRILVTGGGGSIGAEMCLRAAAFGAAQIVVVESSEPALFRITETLAALDAPPAIRGIIADIRDRDRIAAVIAEARPDLVFHAAALKHVPYLEQDWTEGAKTNVFGSLNVMDAALAAGVRTLVMISTDKAIDPVSMLGVTKRFAEMYAQALDAGSAAGGGTRFIAVRFGNVLGSAGSVVPKFKEQIARGGPLTITHPDMVRYFMTVREAADLVLTAASHADEDAHRATGEGERGAVFVLKMGQPVRILDLAERMIRLAGFEPGQDIEIRVTGARPGERLHEILFAREEPMAEIGIAGVMAAKPVFVDKARLAVLTERLWQAVSKGDRDAATAVFEEAVPEFRRRNDQAVPDPDPATEAAEAAPAHRAPMASASLS